VNTFLNKLKTTNKYIYFFVRCTVFILLFFIVDALIGTGLSHFYGAQKKGWDYRTKYSIENTTANLLLIGSSRVQQQYNPTYFEDRLHITCYNAGRDGETFLYQYALLQGVLNRYQPKAILLECENNMFLLHPTSYERLSCLLPFYKNHQEMRPVLEKRSSFEKIKLFSQMYPYNSLLFKIAIGNLSKSDDEDIKGYVPLTGALQEAKRQVNFDKKYVMDSLKIHLFTQLVQQCADKKIKLYLTCSPYFSEGYGTDQSLQLAKQIAQKYAVPFIDLSKGHPLLQLSNLYDDTAHVNSTGSKILSNIIVDSLLQHQ
jgi:hypothetical protein